MKLAFFFSLCTFGSNALEILKTQVLSAAVVIGLSKVMLGLLTYCRTKFYWSEGWK